MIHQQIQRAIDKVARHLLDEKEVVLRWNKRDQELKVYVKAIKRII